MNISYLRDGEAYTADNLNRPMMQLETLINGLQSQLDQIEGKSYLLSEGVPMDQTSPVAVGNVVYMGTDGKVRKALAVWNASADQSGILTPADSAFVYGIVIAVNTDAGTADVMTGGSVTRTSEIASGMAPDGVTLSGNGIWYLSDQYPGKICKPSGGKPYLRIPVVNSDSARFTMVGATPAYGYHVHKVFTIGPAVNWTESGGVYTYSGSAIADLTFFNWTDATFTVDGVQDYEGVFSLEESNGAVVVKATSNPNGKTVLIYTAVPVSHEEPIVRGIKAVGSGRLYASSENGLVTIGVDGWETEEPTPGYRDRAISKMTPDGGYEMTKVVSSLVGDETVSVREGTDGKWVISAMGGPFLRPVTTSLQNSTITTSNGALYYVFPKSRASSVMGSINIPAPPEGWKWKAYPFVTKAYSSISLTASLVFSPNLDFNVSGSAPSAVSPTQSLSVAASGGVMTGKAANGWTLTTGGSSWLTLTSQGSNASDMNILSFGLWLEAVEV